MSPEILVFLVTGLLSALVGLYGLFGVVPVVFGGSKMIFVGTLIASAYFLWLSAVYFSVVVGINNPANYSGFIRPLFNGLLIGIFLIFIGIVKHKRGQK